MLKIRPKLILIFISMILLSGGCAGCGGCGPTVSEMRLCENIKDGKCPEPFTMFVRNQRVLYFSAMPDGLKAGDALNVELEYRPAPGKSRSILKAGAKASAEDKPIAVRMRPRRLAVGRYALKVTSPAENFRARTLRFDVFRTRREIQERLKLGDKNGAEFKVMHICPKPKGEDVKCEKDFPVIPRGTASFLAYFEIKDALADSGLTIEWYSINSPLGRNRRLSTSRQKFESSRSYSGWFSFGYKGRTWKPGLYRVVVTASKSKAAPVTKDFRVR